MHSGILLSDFYLRKKIIRGALTMGDRWCNAPMGRVRPDVGEGVQLLGKSMGSYGKPETTRARL